MNLILLHGSDKACNGQSIVLKVTSRLQEPSASVATEHLTLAIKALGAISLLPEILVHHAPVFYQDIPTH